MIVTWKSRAGVIVNPPIDVSGSVSEPSIRVHHHKRVRALERVREGVR